MFKRDVLGMTVISGSKAIIPGNDVAYDRDAIAAAMLYDRDHIPKAIRARLQPRTWYGMYNDNFVDTSCQKLTK